VKTPPPDYDLTLSEKARSRRNTTTIVLIVLASTVGVCLLFTVVLAAILFPVFSSARVKAREVACASNVKQLSLGVLMYSQDYDERLPPATTWGTMTMPYVKNTQVHYCPERPGTFSYAYNQKLNLRPLEKVSDPMGAPMLYDSSTGLPNATDQRRRGRRGTGAAPTSAMRTAT
jgi:hypothetical protein